MQKDRTGAIVGMTAFLWLCLGPHCLATDIRLNGDGYFEARGFNLIPFQSDYNGMFFDEKTSGLIIIHHGVRTATGGAVRVNPTPEQWDPIPKASRRTLDNERNTVEIDLDYADLNFDCRLVVKAEGDSIRIQVLLDTPLPEELEGRAGFNLEFLPSTYFGKTYQMDEKVAIFPRYPASPMTVRSSREKLSQFAGHVTFDDRGRDEFVEPNAIAEGKTLILGPEDPTCRIQIETTGSASLQLLDGRNVAQNGWFVVRSLIPSEQTGVAVEWLLTPTVQADWVREPVIGYSQVGYLPSQEKVAVVELDQLDEPLSSATVQRLNARGDWVEHFKGDTEGWGDFFRYHYVRFDFSEVQEPGLYRIVYGSEQSGPILIGSHVLDKLWHPTLDVWFPVQMDHMLVNEAYRVWHGAAHLDDARQAPLNHQHFDGYRSGETTETDYAPGERIPGLNVGGWFDAGDFDIRTGSHCSAVLALVNTWDLFQPDRDETLVNQQDRFVDLHHPDGKPDLLQQIEHGALALLAQHRAFGRAIPGIIVPKLHQYHHLGDGAAMTDNLPYNPALKPNETDGISSGKPDDRWAFTGKSSRSNLSSIAALAAASRALQKYDKQLSDECLAAAVKAWNDEQQRTEPEDSRRVAFRRSSEMQALLELYLTTRERDYADKFQERLWQALKQQPNRNIGVAVRAIPHLDADYKAKLAPYVEEFRAANEELLAENPYGVPISTSGWAGNSAVISWAITNYHLHQAFPETIGKKYTCRGLNYVFGCHPYSNVSFVSGVGLQSKTVAYGNNRADFSFIAGGVVPGVLLIRPDFFENKNDWPFLWGENEYVIDVCADYILLANAAADLAKKADE